MVKGGDGRESQGRRLLLLLLLLQEALTSPGQTCGADTAHT